MILEAVSRSGIDGDYQRADGGAFSKDTGYGSAHWDLDKEGARTAVAALTSEVEADSAALRIGPHGSKAVARIGGIRGGDGGVASGARGINICTGIGIEGEESSSGCHAVPLLSRQELLDMAFTTARGIHDAVRALCSWTAAVSITHQVS